MQIHSHRQPLPHRALILIPGTVNYFYNQSGRRVGEALESLGFAVEVTTLGDCLPGEREVCILSNVSEILHAHGHEEDGLARIQKIGEGCRVVFSLGIDCVSTQWYQRIRDFSARAGVGTILDLGLFDQSPFLPIEQRASYGLVFAGLTPSEERMLDAMGEDDAGRTIPWAFVGSSTPTRVALVDHLVQRVDPRGFVYMPPPAPYLEQGSPHLNQEQFERVLARTRYQVWCSGHSYFYMEPERFRASLLTGGVPVKILDRGLPVPDSVPLGYLMMEAPEVGGRLTERVFARIRRRFRADWRGFPTLADELARELRRAGIEFEAGRHSTRAA